MLFNANAAELWRRFTTYLPRRLAALAGVTVAQLRRDVRVRYVKVAEYQARGVVHFHAVIRLDATGDTYQPPPGRYTTGLLADAITQAAAAAYVAADRDNDASSTVLLRFGTQTDTRPIRHGPDGPLTAQAVANYIGKYATKSFDAPGLPARPVRSIADIHRLTCSRHYQKMIATAWQLGGALPDGGQRLRRWAHTLGYGGHYLTKSRRYSVTFGQLRAARTEHSRAQRHPDGEPTRGVATSTRPSSWSSLNGDTPEPVTTPSRISNSRYRPLHAPAHTTPGPTTPPEPSPDRRRSDAHMNPAADRLLTVAQAAELLATSERFPRRLIAERRIRFVRVRRHVRIPESALREFVAAGMVEPITAGDVWPVPKKVA